MRQISQNLSTDLFPKPIFWVFPFPKATMLLLLGRSQSEQASEHGKALLLLCCKSTFLPTGLRLSPSDPRPVGHPCSRGRVDGCIQFADRDNPVLATSSPFFCRLYRAKKRKLNELSKIKCILRFWKAIIRPNFKKNLASLLLAAFFLQEIYCQKSKLKGLTKIKFLFRF